MLIRMRWQMSGGRHDGRPWPPGGPGATPFEVPDWEGADLIRGGMADPADAAARKFAESLAEQPTPGHPSKLDPRPAAQIEAEDSGDAGEERIKAAAAAREAAAQLRAGERESAESYARDGIMGAPGSEVPEAAGDREPGPEPFAAGTGSPDAGQDIFADDLDSGLGAPGPSSPKQAWIDYAVAQGADVHAAGNMTKADLMSRYGGRL